VTKVYRKKTHTQRYLNWDSNHSKNSKLGTLMTLIHRAHSLCDWRIDLLNELDLLKDVFINNGYPPHLVEKTLKKSWSAVIRKEMMSKIKKDGEEISEFYDVIQAPYVKGFTESLQKNLRAINVGVVSKKAGTIRSMISKTKCPRDKDETKDVVYKIDCRTCGKAYIGETSKTIRERKDQHRRDVIKQAETNGIYNHLKMNRRHKIEWEQHSILEKEKNWKKRRIKEALFINALNPQNGICNVMNIEKGMKIDNVWNALCPQIKELIF
jgi:hypothetical protein